MKKIIERKNQAHVDIQMEPYIYFSHHIIAERIWLSE